MEKKRQKNVHNSLPTSANLSQGQMRQGGGGGWGPGVDDSVPRYQAQIKHFFRETCPQIPIESATLQKLQNNLKYITVLPKIYLLIKFGTTTARHLKPRRAIGPLNISCYLPHTVNLVKFERIS